MSVPPRAQEVVELVVDACDAEIGLALEWVAHVMHRAGIPVMFDDGQDEFIRLIEGSADFAAGDRHRPAPRQRVP